ncbi:hypothetical protein [Allobaculum sp. JKK-2023]|uniref:hypothetical protein n=1 Tax=Allobaculum sp. JKK-2023 TaxID=3108943 RepID=UPI002B05E3FD|nr:hypothetical protein [Allobaculum sp. JKK-2023]
MPAEARSDACKKICQPCRLAALDKIGFEQLINMAQYGAICRKKIPGKPWGGYTGTIKSLKS